MKPCSTVSADQSKCTEVPPAKKVKSELAATAASQKDTHNPVKHNSYTPDLSRPIPSLDEQLAAIMNADTPKMRIISLTPDPRVMCSKCKCETMLYKLGCKHLLCRTCLLAIQKQKNECVTCRVIINHKEVVKVH